eukprot:scaffold4604_cov71-Cylindrotheca_fusiformis.AAC.1
MLLTSSAKSIAVLVLPLSESTWFMQPRRAGANALQTISHHIALTRRRLYLCVTGRVISGLWQHPHCKK